MAVRFRKYFEQCRPIACNSKKSNQCPGGIPVRLNGTTSKCGAWYLEFFDENRRWRSMTFKDIKTKSDAEKRYTLIIADRERGKFNLPKLRSIPTLREYCKKYLTLCKNSKENTLLSKQRAVNVLVEYLGDYRLDRLNEVVVERFIIQRQEGGTKPGTINEDVSKLKNVLNTACRAGILNSNLCKGVKKLKVTQARDRVLTDSEIAVVLKGECLRAKDRLMILVSLFTGMRLNEVVSLKWSDIDFAKNLISVIQCKTGKALIIPISTYFVSELQAYKTNSPGDGVFEDKPLTQNLINGYSRYFVKLFKRLGFRGFTFHNLRHSFASLCGDLGTGAVITKELLGHSDLSMTLRYSHIGFDTKRNAIESLTNHILAMNQEKVIVKIPAQA